MSAGEMLFKGMLYEYVGVVTQLAGTSEVATIGLTLTCPTGERVVVINSRNTIDDLSAGKDIDILINNTAAAAISQQSDSLDNQYHQGLPLQSNVGASVVNVEGMYQPLILGGGMLIRFSSADTLDATKIMTIRVLYWSRKHKMVSTVIGAGISISSEVHKSI